MLPPWWVVPGAVLWSAVLALPWRPWSTRERLEAGPAQPATDLGDLDVLVPARNEAPVVGTALRSLAAQGRGLRVVLIDDQSSDGTARLARAAGLEDLTVIGGRPVPPGWSGKVWALEQGRARLERPLVLLMDADIALAPGTLAALRSRLRERGAGLVSVMAELPMGGFWERLLTPAFIYFFKLLYPFGLVNAGSRRVCAAAGGCVLLEARLLEDIGGFGALRDELIDDCALAARARRAGYRCWIGLSRSVRSVRPRSGLRALWEMVARTAFTQLRYSALWLALCTLLMAAAFLAPLAGLAAGSAGTRLLAGATLAAMMASYLPVLRFYGRSPLWAPALPAVGMLYLGMTWHSALRYWRGTRSRWKDREYRRAPRAAGRPA